MFRFALALLFLLCAAAVREDSYRYGSEDICKSIANEVCKRTLSEGGNPTSEYGAESDGNGTEQLVNLIMERLTPVFQGLSDKIDALKANVEQDAVVAAQVMSELRDFLARNNRSTTSRSGPAVVSCQAEARGRAESSYTVTCQGGCGQTASSVWGTGIYTDDSSICKAAIHDGKIAASEGGTVTVYKIEGKSSYRGTTRHSVTTKSYGSWPGSFVFEGPQRVLFQTLCTGRANDYSHGVFNVECPSGCDDGTVHVWGTAIYTDDSSICQAAIHDGRITAHTGGSVTVYKLEGKSNYAGSTKNGITTRSYGRWNDSFSFHETA